MKSIFTRVFVSVCLLIGAIIAGTVATTALVTWQRLMTRDAINLEVLMADASVAARRGDDQFRNWLNEARHDHSGIEIYALTASGEEVLGRKVPPRLLQWLALNESRPANTRPRRPGAPGIQLSATHLLDNATITGAEGAQYNVLVAWFGSSFMDVLGSYDVLLLLVGLMLTVSACVSLWLAHYVSAPIRQLQTSARIIAQGEFDARVEDRFCRRQDEIGILARDFNQMAAQLETQLSAKELLLRDVSHELRSPLTRIRMALDLAALQKPDQPEQFRRIERDVERMDALIGEILQLARLAAPSAPAKTFLSLNELVSEIVEDARLEASSLSVTISADIPDHLYVDGNRELLRRAIENVLRNALRYSPRNGSVQMLGASTQSTVLLEIRDQGAGVPVEELSLIFEPFYRVSKAREHNGGVGVGLAISSRVMSLHGGHITARNNYSGGLIVDFQFPAPSRPPGEPCDGIAQPLGHSATA